MGWRLHLRMGGCFVKIILKNGAKYVLRKRKGQQYAAAFEADLDNRQIFSRIVQGEAAFFPFNTKKWEFDWSKDDGKPKHFRR